MCRQMRLQLWQLRGTEAKTVNGSSDASGALLSACDGGVRGVKGANEAGIQSLSRETADSVQSHAD